MRIVIAPDSYKGTMSQLEVCRAMEQAISVVLPDVELISKPMADGGEGSLAVLMQGESSIRESSLLVTGPSGEGLETKLVLLEDQTALIEVAEVIGLPLVEKKSISHQDLTSFGLGQLIQAALDAGARKFLVGLGGSASNDGGFGMLQALGVKFLDDRGQLLGKYTRDLARLATIDLSEIDSRLSESHFIIMSDVSNPLCGAQGATAIFGPQKGIKKEEIQAIDKVMNRYGQRMLDSQRLPESLMEQEGAGAAGGLGFAFLWLGGEIVDGAEFIARETKLEEAIKRSDYVFTGEGKSDSTTISGKAPMQVANLAKKYQLPCILVSGSVEEKEQLMNYFTKVYSLVDDQVSVDMAINHPEQILINKMKTIIKETMT